MNPNMIVKYSHHEILSEVLQYAPVILSKDVAKCSVPLSLHAVCVNSAQKTDRHDLRSNCNISAFMPLPWRIKIQSSRAMTDPNSGNLNVLTLPHSAAGSLQRIL